MNMPAGELSDNDASALLPTYRIGYTGMLPG